MVPTSAQAVLGPPDHGGMVRRIIWFPFQGVTGSDADRYPLAQNFQYGGRCDVMMLAHDYDGGGSGIRWV